MSSKIGCASETSRKWVRQAELDRGARAGVTSKERHRLKELERINVRLIRSLDFEQHFIRGLSRMRTYVGLPLSVVMALVLGQVRVGPRSGCARCTARFPGPTPPDRVVPPSLSRSGLPGQTCAHGSMGSARACRPPRLILPLYEGPMRGFMARLGVGPPRRAVSSTPGAVRWHQPSARKPHNAHASLPSGVDFRKRLMHPFSIHVTRSTVGHIGRRKRCIRNQLVTPLLSTCAVW